MGFLPNHPSRCTWTRYAEPSSSPHTQKALPIDAQLLKQKEKKGKGKDKKAKEKPVDKKKGKDKKGQSAFKREVPMPVYDSVLETIGKTPMIKLERLAKLLELPCQIYAKCEFVGPFGAHTQRPALRMFEDFEETKSPKEEQGFVEGSLDSTGKSVALVGSIKGYPTTIVLQQMKASKRELNTLQAVGAQTILIPPNLPLALPEGLFGTVCKLVREDKNLSSLDIYTNPSNPLAHYDWTSAELVDQIQGKVDAIVMHCGSTGTITGIGRRIKTLTPNCLIIGADSEGCLMAIPPYLNRSEAECEMNFVPTVLDRSVIDHWIKTTEAESNRLCRLLAETEGLLCGINSGSCLEAAIQVAKDMNENQTIIVVFPDSITFNLDTFPNLNWMEARGFLPNKNMNRWWWYLDLRQLTLPLTVTTKKNCTCHKAIHIFREHKCSHLVIVGENDELIGIVVRRPLMASLLLGKLQGTSTIESLITSDFSKMEIDLNNMGALSKMLYAKSPVVLYEYHYSAKFGALEKPVALILPEHFLRFIANENNRNKYDTNQLC